jgi:hypothetical protein
MIEAKDLATCHKLADIFETPSGNALVFDESNRRRIWRVACQASINGDVPPDMGRDRRTGELRERLWLWRRKE